MSKLALRLIHENIDKHQHGEDASSIDLGNCGLTQLPEELRKCIWLETLILSNGWWDYGSLNSNPNKRSQNQGEPNHLASIQGLEQLPALKKLVLAGEHGLNTWELQDLSPLSSLPQLAELDCSCTHVSDLSPLSGLIKLQELNCSYTQVSELNPLSGLRSLQRLYCSDIQLSDLSPLNGLSKLQQLDCAGTQVSDLSPLSRLSHLRILSCADTQVSDLSPLSGLIHLQQLYCSNTQVIDLSPLSGLSKLQELKCSRTQVSDLSPLSGLSSLQRLDCSSTQVSDLTPMQHLIKKGVLVKLDYLGNGIIVLGCPLSNPPLEIVAQGNAAILNWFSAQEKQGVRKLNEAKLLILGEGGAGKTTLVKRILYGFGQSMPIESTHGIEIHPFRFPCGQGEEFSANIWDFGGQEIYHATHEFFLTDRSLYVLVDDARQDDTRFDYWLQIVELLSHNSPLLIVQNCKAGRRRYLDEAGFKARFQNIKDISYLDLSQDQERLAQLKERIKMELRQLPHTTEVWPRNWVGVRSELELLRTKGEKSISIDRYKGICQKFNLESNQSETLGKFLHDLGVALWFSEDPLLKRSVFLDSQWMVNGVYEVLDDEDIRDQQGRFSRRDASLIWDRSEYREYLDDLLQLMMKFELCYPIAETSDEYLVPHLLPASTPKMEWNMRDNIQLHYRYTFMPKGLLSRLMVRQHRLLKDTKLAWRTGVVFELDRTRLRVVETYGEKYLRLHAKGVHAREMMTIISDEIDRLNAGYHGLKVEKQVPCNCAICKKLDIPNFYDYDDLMRRKELGKRTIECSNSYDDVDVLRVLDHVFTTPFFADQPKKLFISYSKRDKVHLETLKKHLEPLRRQQALLSWDDNDLHPGEEWDSTIRRQIATADLVLLLVSSDFLASDYIWQEIGIAMERHKRGQARVVPIIVRPCDWIIAPFGRIRGLPINGKPISAWSDPDAAWVEVVKQIRKLVEGEDSPL